MLMIHRRHLVATLLIVLLSVAVALAIIASAHLLGAAVQGGAPPRILADLLSGVDANKLERHLTTVSEIVRNLAISGVCAAAMVGVLLAVPRRTGEREHYAIDERVMAFMALVLWFVVFNLFFPQAYGDENVHQRAIAGIYRGDWEETQPLSMIPGYHFLVAMVSETTGPRLIVSRSVTLLSTFGMLLCYLPAAKKWQGARAGQATLGLALLPILFPFAVAVYTDSTSMLIVAGALWALVARRYNLSAALMFISCFVRQSNLVWMAFMAALASWEIWIEWRPTQRPTHTSWREFVIKAWLPHVFGYGVAAIVFLVFLLATTKGLIWGNVPMNRAHPNIAQVYTLSFFILLLWAPLWIERFAGDVRSLKAAAASHRIAATTIAAALLALGIVLVITYRNFHIWNQYWYYLRNNPLMWMDQYVGLRVVGVLAVYWTGWAAFQLWRSQPHRAELALVAAFTALFLAPQALVEPRYFVLPFALANLFLLLSVAQGRRLVVWWSVLCGMICAVIVLGHLRSEFLAW